MFHASGAAAVAPPLSPGVDPVEPGRGKMTPVPAPVPAVLVVETPESRAVKSALTPLAPLPMSEANVLAVINEAQQTVLANMDAYRFVVQPGQMDIHTFAQDDSEEADSRVRELVAGVPFLREELDRAVPAGALLRAVRASRSLSDPKVRYAYLLSLLRKVQPAHPAGSRYLDTAVYAELHEQLELIGGDALALSQILRSWVRNHASMAALS